MSTAQDKTAGNQRLLTFAGGGWVLAVMGLLCLGLVAWALAPAILRTINRPPGDGKHIESYGFDLSNLQVPRDLVVPATLHRDMVPVMTNATSSDLATMQRINDPQYGKYLVPSDMVIGVEIHGEARAYPIHVMYVHEIINDTLGPADSPQLQVPIAVTYNWVCDSVMVFDRRVEGFDKPLEFHVSGLAYNSNLLMYDKHDQPANASPKQSAANSPNPGAKNPYAESLWSQLLAKAVSGPAAGTPLTIIHAELTRWDDWSARHPHTTVLNRNLSMVQRYKDAAPTPYFQSDRLLFPVKPMPPDGEPAAKSDVIAVSVGESRRVYPVQALIERARAGANERPHDAQPIVTDSLGGSTLRFIFTPDFQAVRVEAEPADVPLRATRAFWFAWHAMFPDDPLWKP